MLIRRRIDAAHNFTNKPVFFACNGVQTRRRVSHKADTKEGGRTAQNSRNASRAWNKILQMAAQRAAGVPDDRRKTAASGAAPRTHNRDEARGRDKGKGERLRTVGGYRGEEERGRSRREREEGTTRRKGSAWRSGMGADPRACVYI